MKRFYLFLTALGFILPNIWVAKVSIETGNLLLYVDPVTTMQHMFANDIATAFIIDLLVVVSIFMIWSASEAKKYGIKNLWFIWLLTFLFGLAGSFPLFMYLREKKQAA